MTTEPRNRARCFCKAAFLLLAMLVSVVSTSTSFAQTTTVRFAGITPTVDATGEWSARIFLEGCDAVTVPPNPPELGGFLQVDVSGNNIALRVGYEPDGILGTCPSPLNPFELAPVPMGPLSPGSYQLDFIGVVGLPGVPVELSLGTFQVVVPAPPRRIPAGSPLPYALLIGGLALVGLIRMRLGT